MDTRRHWEKIYTTRAPEQVSWYRPHLETSLALIERATTGRSTAVIEYMHFANLSFSKISNATLLARLPCRTHRTSTIRERRNSGPD